MDLICEMGATTVRLAHYQHDQYFYDLCDERGLIVWAEIPYITNYMPKGRENVISHMNELIHQNYNHPSIAVWGLSNEITVSGGNKNKSILDEYIELKEMIKEYDKQRLTAIAVVSGCDIHDSYIKVPDLVSYNYYLGWYGGNVGMNGPWFDRFHKAYLNIPIGMSEYGCEALNWHTSNLTQGDYSEEYQVYYHEEMIKQLFSRPYMWATHVWNMFDFGADDRNEGGEAGQNHKGLVSFDRKYKKDAFYAYKAWLSDEPFVHICSKGYVDRVEEETKITVYSNLPEVELFANGLSLGKKKSEEHFFYYNVKNIGSTKLKAVAGDCVDESEIKKVSEMNEDYVLKDSGVLLNWFDVITVDGYLSLNDNLGEILICKESRELIKKLIAEAVGDVSTQTHNAFDMDEIAQAMIDGDENAKEAEGCITFLRFCGMMGAIGIFLVLCLGDPSSFSFVNINTFTILFMLFFIVMRGFGGMSSSIVTPMTADCVDYEVYRGGKYVTGLMGTLFSFIDKVVSSFATTIIAVLLAMIGFKDVQPTPETAYSPEIFWVTIILVIGFPLLGWILNIIALKFYPLNKEKMEEIQSSIAKIKSENTNVEI